MKNTKLKVLVITLAVCLLAIGSFSTLAWFTDSDEVTNQFLIADSDDLDPDDIFSINVYENTPDGDGEESGYVYEDILPGDKLEKEVRVKNTGYYDQYVRVTVTITDAKAWIDALGANADPAALFDGFKAEKWNHVWNNLSESNGTIPENLTYVLYYNDVVEAGDVIEVFNNVMIPTTLTKEQAAEFAGGFNVTVKAEAVQTENVVPEGTAPADAAWAAFKTIGA